MTRGTEGVHDLIANGTINAGDPVISTAAGAVATGASATNYAQVLGVALTTATNGNPVRVNLRS